MENGPVCPSESEVLFALDPAAPAEVHEQLCLHLSECTDCRSLVAGLARDRMREAPPPDRTGRAPQPGDRVGPYRLTHRIGQGGVSTVWRATHPHGHDVALKWLTSADVQARRRMRREAMVAMRLDHPHILRAFDVVEDDALGVVLAMPWLDGTTLEEIFAREGRLSPSRAASLLVPVLEALAYAHAQGVVHRDLTPRNVMVTKDHVWVLDFGVARLVDHAMFEGSTITRTGDVLGTPRYMAPEQVFGERDVDARADVWAASLLAYRALTGISPVVGSSLGEILRFHTHGTMAPIGEPTPPALVATIMHGLERERAARPPTTEPLRRALAVHRGA